MAFSSPAVPAPRVLVTREHAEPLCELLGRAGLMPIHVPLVSLAATGMRVPAGKPSLVLVTSAAVARFVPDLARMVGDADVVAVGKRTAEALRGIGLMPVATGRTGGAEAVALMASRMSAQLKRGQVACAWHVGAEVPATGLARALAALDFEVERWVVYRNHIPADATARLAEVGTVDAVTLASGSAARALAGLGGAPGALCVVLGPSTAAAAEAAGMSVSGMAASPVAADMVAAVKKALGA